MAQQRVDEVLDKALETDATVIPRFAIKDATGNTVVNNATIELLNPVIVQGMSVNKVAMDECLAASGTTTGTSDALLLEQAGFALFDGATVRFKLHADMNPNATLNVNSTGAVKILDMTGKPQKAKAGSWCTVIYNDVSGNFTLQGNGGGTLQYGNAPGQISTFELFMNMFNPFYRK